MKEKKLTIFPDGAVMRYHNRRIQFKEFDSGLMIAFQTTEFDENKKPAVHHEITRGKIMNTGIKLSVEAMESLITAYIEYKKSKSRNTI